MPDEIYNRDMLLIMAVRFLEKQYGEGVVEALAEWKDDRTRERWEEIAEATGRSDPEYLFRLFSDAVHEYEVIRKDREALEVRVTRCAHAEAFRGFNAADVGLKMICMGDHAVVEGFNPGIRFTRTKTIMAGDDCCNFSFELAERG
jgi:predicted ArsR family transcriptional regulator